MDGLALALLALLLLAMALLSFLVLRLHRQLHTLQRPEGPESSLLMLQGQLDALRDEVRRSLEGGRLELNRRLEETNRVVGDVRRGLGEVDRQARLVADSARDLRGLQELLRSPKVRGGIGEYMLADLLSQVLPRSGFSLQHAFAGGERVDAVIHVGELLVPVDAKFPMENFTRLAAADGEDRERAARRALLTDCKRHIDHIARRYIRPGEGTYEFALMYIPSEAVYQEAALQQSDDGLELLEYALSRRVVPVSPQSFYAYLQVILLGLRGLSIEGRAREILERLGLVRTRLEQFSESFELACGHLGRAQRQIEVAQRRLDRLDLALDEISEPAQQRQELAGGIGDQPAAAPGARVDH